MAYDKLSPIGPERLDLLFALLRYDVAAPWSKGRLKPADFLVRWDPEPEQKDPKALGQALMQWGRLQNARLRRGKHGDCRQLSS